LSGTIYPEDATFSQAGTDQGTALSVGLTPQDCTFTFGAGITDLGTDTTHNSG